MPILCAVWGEALPSPIAGKGIIECKELGWRRDAGKRGKWNRGKSALYTRLLSH